MCETELLVGFPYTVQLCCRFIQFGGFFHFVLVLLTHTYTYCHTLGGGKGYYRLTVLIGNKKVSTEITFCNLKKILQKMENLKSA